MVRANDEPKKNGRKKSVLITFTTLRFIKIGSKMDSNKKGFR